VGEEPTAAEKLEATREAIAAQRAELQRTSDQLRDALDVRQRFKENPALFIGLGAGAVFLVANGPVRVARMVRRRVFRSNPEKAYDSLPKPMQTWVDHMTGALGPGAAEARRTMSEELLRWRHDPRKHGKVSKKLAQQIAEGPPGPQRVAWNALEAGAAILTAALARKAIERFLSGPPPSGIETLDTLGTLGGAAESDSRRGAAATPRASERSDYSGMSASRIP
jgi:hypothetical protein